MNDDFLIVLRAVSGAELRKVYTREGDGWSVAPYADAKTFTAARVRVDGLGALHKHLQRLASLPECCVIRGAPRAHLDLSARHFRNYHDAAPTPDDPTPAPASYDAADHRWMAVDVDAGDFPPELRGGADLTRCAAHVVSRLPDWIKSAGWIVQWSNSAGTDGWKRIKAHVWIWMDRGVCDESARVYWRELWNKGGRYAEGGLEVDPVIYNPVQVHYTAPPRFVPEQADPCLRELVGFDLFATRPIMADQRIVYAPGPPAVAPAALTDLATWQRLERERDAAERSARKLAAGRKQATSTVWGAAVKLTKYGEVAMARAVDAVRALVGDPSYYLKLRAETYSTFGLVAQGALTEDQWRSGWEDARDRLGLELSSKDLKRLLDGAERKSKARDLSHVGGSTDAADQLQLDGSASSARSEGFGRHNAP